MFNECRLIWKSIECFTAMINKHEIPFEYSDYVLRAKFREIATRQNWLHSGKIILAVSGGGDSTALAWFFHKYYDGEFMIAHVNHNLRGEDAERDEAFVKNLASEMQVEFAAKKVSVGENILPGESVESAGRRIRHSVLVEFAKNSGVRYVALAHNRDDLAETVLFNILRGSGIRGSVGIPEISEFSGVKFFRPLMAFRREFLREFLRVRGLSWREDVSNQDSKYTRNFLRLELLPLIAKNINSNAIEHLAEFAEDMRPVRESEESRSYELLERVKIHEANATEHLAEFAGDMRPVRHEAGLKLDAKKLRKIPEPDLKLIIRKLGRNLNLQTLSRNRCNELSRLLAKSEPFVFQWSGAAKLESKGGVLSVTIGENS